MNVLMYTLNNLKFTIPYELLHAAFTIDEFPEIANLTSLDEKILRKCIRARVLQDCNVVRGVETVIPLGTVQPIQIENYFTVYNIPPEVVNNREIISALSLTYMPNQYLFQGSSAGFTDSQVNAFRPYNAINNVASRIGNSASDIAVLSNAQLEIVAYNTVLVYANYRQLANFGLRVVLENENNLQNISTRSYETFSHLCTLAIKSYIYNKLIIKINSGYLQGGQDLGMFKNILESYEGSEVEYRTYLKEVWRSVAMMNDTVAYSKHLRSMLNPGL